MGVTRPKRLWPALGWAWIVIVPAASAQDLPPLIEATRPSAPIKVDAPAVRPAHAESNANRVEKLLEESENQRPGGDDFDRFWFLDQPSHLSPFRTHGGLGFDPVDFKAETPTTKAEPLTKKPEPPAPKPAEAPLPLDSDPAAVLAEATGRLETLPADDAREATATTEALRALLAERVKVLKEREQLIKDRHDAEHPEPSPEALAAGWKADLERVNVTLDRAARDRDALLPASFRNIKSDAPESARAELKEAIDAAEAELKDWSSKLEQFRSDPTRKEGAALAAARARRDKTQQHLTVLKARNAEREAALAAARTPEARSLARESLVNGHWETCREAERLRLQEALLTQEAKAAEVSGLNLQVMDAHAQLSKRTLDRMRERYQALAALQERGLHQAAAKEQTLADHSGDPVERYRARRTAELLELEARVLTNENALTTDPSPSYDEQHALAERAESDFNNIKKLLDDGKVSHLDALRLNNDFRRLGAERARIVGRDLAAASERLTKAENTLSAVELEMVNDSRDDRFELENILERVPAKLHPKVEAMFRDFEGKHLALLARRRSALDKLAQRADLAHQEVLRRLRILDDHFGFIRTHMFWVRDEEPVGSATAAQARRDLRQLGRAAVRIGAEVVDPSAWGRLSAEFLVSCVGLVVLPWPLRRGHQALRRLGDVSRTDPTPTEVTPAP